jgi:hypothetical protein
MLSAMLILGADKCIQLKCLDDCDEPGPHGHNCRLWTRELRWVTCCGMIWTFLGYPWSGNFVRNVCIGGLGMFLCQILDSLRQTQPVRGKLATGVPQLRFGTRRGTILTFFG